ncbi:MAG: hypothetical protein MI749_12760 [Desulfovibrionales bacterium]|nr:hypothetical protein [Desulfovibrionales bacterium]
MAAEKKVIVLTAGDVTLDGGAACQKFTKKAAHFVNYAAEDVTASIAALEGATKVAPEALAETFEGGASLALVELGNATGDVLEAALAAALEAADRRTLTVLAAANGLYFYGHGINAKAGSVERAATAADVIPTIGYIADVPVPADTTGAVLYQALKDPNMKMKELAKLKDALNRMETALQRDNREPWDKHDCA